MVEVADEVVWFIKSEYDDDNDDNDDIVDIFPSLFLPILVSLSRRTKKVIFTLIFRHIMIEYL